MGDAPSGVSIARLHAEACFHCGKVARHLVPDGSITLADGETWPVVTCGCNWPDALVALLAEAFIAARTLPASDRRAELDVQLRAEAGRLMPLVQAQADRLNRGTCAWYSRDKALSDTRDALATPLSASSLAACSGLAQLARSVRVLGEYAGGEA